MSENDEECIRCGRLAVEGSNLCEKCIAEENDYDNWKEEIRNEHREFYEEY